MRLIAKKIWRAFPELDRFSDEHCAKFVRAANQQRFHRVARWAAVTLLAACTMAGGGVLVRWYIATHQWMDYTGDFWLSWRGPVTFLGGAALCAGAGLVAGLMLRDRLLRRRVRAVIRDRGRCGGCRYVLLGLPVGKDLGIRCPECGVVTLVDSSLGELVVDADEQRAFRPVELEREDPAVIARRRRRRKRAVRIVLVLLLIGAATIGGWKYWRWQQLVSQAATAMSHRTGEAEWAALIKAHEPSAAGTDGRAIIEKVGPIIDTTIAKLWPYGTNPKTSEGYEVALNWRAFDDPEFDSSITTPGEYGRLAREMGAKLVAQLRTDGVLDQLDALAGADRYAALTAKMQDGRTDFGDLNLWRGSDPAGLNIARMWMAIDRGDREEFLRALETSLAIARLMMMAPTWQTWAYADYARCSALRMLREGAGRFPDPTWLTGAQEVMRRQHCTVGPELAIDSAVVRQLDHVRWYLSDATRADTSDVREVARTMGWTDEGRVGTLEENERAVQEISEMYRAAVKRRSRDIEQPPPSAQKLGLVANMLVELPPMLNLAALVPLDELATDLTISLERFRRRNGRYPDALEQLVPQLLPGVPVDPWSGRPFVYEHHSAANGQPDDYMLRTTGSPDNRFIELPFDTIKRMAPGPNVGFLIHGLPQRREQPGDGDRK